MFIWNRRRAERELEEELAFHLEQAARKHGSRGRAEAALGGTEAIKEACRDERAGAWLASVGRDLRLGARILRKSPGFTIAAVFTLGLCIGCVVTVFGLLDQALLQAPPFPQPDRILAVTSVLDGNLAPGNPVWAGDYADFRTGASAFAALAAYGRRNFNLAGTANTTHVDGMAVTGDFFKVLGVAPAQGRTFLPGEDQPGHEHEAILSDALWREQFAAAPMLGKTVLLDGVPYTVVGIMPRNFAQGAYNYYYLSSPSLWVPWVIPPTELGHTRKTSASTLVIGRLRSGATLTEAQSQLQAIARHEAEAHPDEQGMGETALTLQKYSTLIDNQPAALAMFMTLAGMILLIGCANVAGLGMGRAAARSGEMAIRRALGAGRARLVRQALTESALLAGLAGACGLLMGWLGMAGLNAAIGGLGSRLDSNVLAVAAAAVAITIIGAGLPPALRAGARVAPRGVIVGRSRGRDALVAIEIALTVASLVVIALVVRSIQWELRLPLGFDSIQVLTAEISLRGSAYTTPRQRAGFVAHMQEAAAALPGVQSAALVSPPPLDWTEDTLAVSGQSPMDWHGKPMPKVFGITSGYLGTLQVPLLAGRAFTSADAAGAAPVALVSLSVARRLFPNGAAPIGHSIRLDAPGELWREIVGETGDLASYIGDNSTNGEIFEPLAQAPQTNLGLVVRTAGGVTPDALIPPLRHVLARLDPMLALYDAQPLSEEMKTSTGGDRPLMLILELMGAMALLLSAIGLYSVIAYAAIQRRRELGIRMALGATAPQLEHLLLGRGLGLTTVGLAAGLGLGWCGLRLLRSTFASDGWPAHAFSFYAIPVLLLLAVAALASYLPARRAARADPLAALRVE